MRWPRWLIIDPFIAMLFAVVALAALLPVRGTAASVAGVVASVGIALLFFLHGARIAPAAALAGARHWRLHTVVLSTTFVVFPLLGLAVAVMSPQLLPADLYQGVLFLCVVPSTVQSSIAFTSIARGNVPAAVFSASFSNIVGVALTPLLAVLLMQNTGDLRLTAGSIGSIVGQLLLPFVAGQLSRRWTADWIGRHKSLTSVVDRGSILLVVYTAFSAGVVAGIWQQIAVSQLLVLGATVGALLAVVMGLLFGVTRLLGFDHADRAATVFCGAKKSLATGLPMAAVLFSPQLLGLLVLPLMIFHQIQLIVCAALARWWSNRAPVTPSGPPSEPAEPRAPERRAPAGRTPVTRPSPSAR
ncbi:bile acid:sodium symporter family protein [Solwaraspora sp. WMMD792]|uniref:bile acid:sodium symporter family protein n=1 Tax=Solwaraspora sp. WMMD792 TaxID=3016099 RepID=UPI002416273C|nr:bile acid:sodium symporter family protein [Solwaraspora sp. WMMD792]MDG4774577.1 bile acid:sodium symporter [Solwaraspora sp. WMMD792]